MYPSIELFHLGIPTFFVVICLGFALSLFFIYFRLDQWLSKHYWMTEQFGQNIWITAGSSMAGGLIGSRLAHVLYEMPAYYQEHPLEIFYLWNGGYVFFGGLICAILFGWITLALRGEKNKFPYFDFYAPVISLGYAVGRLGCLLNGCCYGKQCSFPWAIRFYDEQGQYLYRHPTQIYSSMLELMILMFLLWWEQRENFYLSDVKERREQKFGGLFAVWLFLHATSRLFLEQLRDDFRGPEFVLSASSWVSLALMALGLVLIFQKFWHPKIL